MATVTNLLDICPVHYFPVVLMIKKPTGLSSSTYSVVIVKRNELAGFKTN